ncbi:zinc finger CCCH domain-containing protein 30 [Dendrobium catenatum]|uniref:Zinc finger CCCH domain-containing protein 30 n=1 Tax=Dendrobium catenatum TaxID=906689 RepID=A0A2I0V8W1_9ASPA|nr:zinc finger CCCH domain-containing protein 30 [Dendrobium catenatum]PKU59847.1 Zinc finger CCCH domain-containing protein 30 [Dendrobium catenatum]
MAGPTQSKRVSWAPGVNLCQVRLFLSEDAPFQSGLGSQDHLQAKAASQLHLSSAASDDSVPPGFEALHKSQIQRNIPSIKWQSPPSHWLKPEWLVVTGEESQEIASQDRRQLGVLEAVYPRLSSIPPDPCVSTDVQLVQFDDSQTLLIPIVAVEDEDITDQEAVAAPTTIPSYFIPPVAAAPEHSLPSSIPPIPNLPPVQKPLSLSSEPGPGTSVKPDIAAAASAAFTAIMRSNEEGSLIDRDLLIKILRDPSMVGKLVSERSAPTQTPLPAQPPSQIASGATNSAYPMHILVPTPAPSLKPPPPSSSTTIPINIPTVRPKAPPTKDVNYYKSLIQKHGGDRHESTEPAPLPYENRHDYHSNPLGSIYGEGAGRRKPKIEKLCAYFNTPRGCREGSRCSYLHDSSTSKKIEHQRASKRIKFDR